MPGAARLRGWSPSLLVAVALIAILAASVLVLWPGSERRHEPVLAIATWGGQAQGELLFLTTRGRRIRQATLHVPVFDLSYSPRGDEFAASSADSHGDAVEV